MPDIIVKETRRRSSSISSSPRRSRRYQAWGSSDVDDIENALLLGTNAYKNGAKSIPFTGLPATDGSLPLNSLDIDLEEDSSNIWVADADYSITQSKTPAETGDEEISFDISPLSTKITHSLGNISRVAATGTAPDFKGGIGWDGEKFTGTEKMVEAFSFTIIKYVPAATALSNAYIQGLRSAAFHFNNAIFRGFSLGELLYVGASGSQRNDDDFAVSHKFMAGLNVTDLSVGPVNGINKKAWEYLWALYESIEDTSANFVTDIPQSVYVEGIYEGASFPTQIGVAA